MPERMLVPQLNPNDQEMEIVQWHVDDGDLVSAGDTIVTLETAKASVDIESQCDGYVLTSGRGDSTISVGGELACFYDSLDELSSARSQGGGSGEQAIRPDLGGAGPSATARETQPELAMTTGAERRAEDAMRLSQSARSYIEAHNIDQGLFRGMGLVTLSKVKQTVAAGDLRSNRISLSKQQEIEILHAGQRGGINSSVTVQFSSGPIRERLSEASLLDGDILPFVLFNLAYTIKQHKLANAYYEDRQLVYHRSIHIGLAMDMGYGLKVPVIRNADRLSPYQLSERVQDFSNRYRNRQLHIEDLQAGTFTVSDLSNDDVMHFQPLLAPKQAAILGIGGDRHAAGHPMSLTLVFDHRVLTGREAARFLNTLKDRMTADD